MPDERTVACLQAVNMGFWRTLLCEVLSFPPFGCIAGQQRLHTPSLTGLLVEWIFAMSWRRISTAISHNNRPIASGPRGNVKTQANLGIVVSSTTEEHGGLGLSS